MKVIGLMSGTSLDGIDAALVEITAPDPDPGARPEWELLAFETTAFTPERREEIHATILDGDASSIARLHARMGEWLAEAVSAVCRSAEVDLATVDLIGSHGQTIWHEPPRDGRRGATLQVGDPATIVERTGVPVVSDFRSRDVAAGGEGAPLVPWVDRLLFATEHVRILQNIGGMANLTRVPPLGSDDPVVAFDTGPGNALIDAAVELATNGRDQFDRGGEWARRGTVDEGLLTELLDDPFLHRPPPKSTGRESFGRGYVQEVVGRCLPSGPDDWADLIATLTAFTARSIAEAVRRWADPGAGGEVILSGGGARNHALVGMIRDALEPVPVQTGDVLGFDPGAKEALAFAVLAWAHVVGRPANLPSVTGAAGPRVLGSFTPAPNALP